MIQDGFGFHNGTEVFKGSKSWELVNAEIARSKEESARKKTGKNAEHWPIPDGKKYKGTCRGCLGHDSLRHCFGVIRQNLGLSQKSELGFSCNCLIGLH